MKSCQTDCIGGPIPTKERLCHTSAFFQSRSENLHTFANSCKKRTFWNVLYLDTNFILWIAVNMETRKLVGFGWSGSLAAQPKQRQSERLGSARRLRLGPTAQLRKLGRTANYEVATLASLCGVSERTLVRAMDADYQQTPSAWLGALQIGDSIPRICEGIRVKTIAAELHFENATHFSRAFKRNTGCTPTEYYRAWVQNGRVSLA